MTLTPEDIPAEHHFWCAYWLGGECDCPLCEVEEDNDNDSNT